jgi:hypothetical protein
MKLTELTDKLNLATKSKYTLTNNLQTEVKDVVAHNFIGDVLNGPVQSEYSLAVAGVVLVWTQPKAKDKSTVKTKKMPA